MPRFATVLALFLIATCVLAPRDSAAQLTRGAIVGTVRDASGSIVPGAEITVTNIGTNAARDAVSDAQGFFRVGALDAGTYRLLVALAGFVSVEQTDIDVRAASDVTLDVVLKPAAVSEAVSVTASAVELNKTSPTIGFSTDARMVVDLPLSVDRNINNIVLTVPNALATNGQGTYAINGQRPRNNNYMIDGTDNNDVTVTIPTSVIVPEAVAEFQVLQNPYSAEFGRNSGGQINVITKSGTNKLRGQAWDYFFTNAFSSVDNLEAAQGRTKPAKYTRHQLGGDLGGPIAKDKLFFYGLYQRDAQRPEDRPSATAVRIPTADGFAALQSAALPLGNGQSRASRDAVLQRIDFLRDIYARNAAFRNLQTTTVNGVEIQTGLTNVNITDPSTYHTVLGRLDYHGSVRDTITARYSLNHREDINSISNCGFGALFCGDQSLVDTNAAVGHTHIFTPRMLNELRVSLVRRDLDFPENDPSSATAVITGLFTIGGANNFPQSRVSRAYQFSDTLTWTVSRHTLKLGADIRYNDVDNVSAFDAKGTFTFNSLQDYINNQAFELRQALQIASWHATQWQTFLFAQDDVRLTPDLTVTAGLRVERSAVPLGLFGATDTQSLSALVPGPVQPDTNWAPRIGFAWTPRVSGSSHALRALLGDGKTVLRGGFGVGYDVLFYNLLTVNGSNYPRIVVDDRFNLQNVYPTVVAADPNAPPVFDPLAAYTNSAADTQNPESRFYSLTVQRDAGKYLFEAGYSGSRGAKGINQIPMNPAILTPPQAALVASTRNANAIPDVQARRLSPQIGPRTLIPAYTGPGGNNVEARSTYDALFFAASRRLSRGVQFRASYTYSRWYSNNDGSLLEGGTDASSQRPQDSFDYGAEWSRSQFDRPHRFAAAYIWEVPGPAPSHGWTGFFFGGWQLSGVTQAQSGRPFTIVTGVDSNGDGISGSDRPNINPAGSLVWDSAHSSFVNNGYYVVPLGTNNLPLANSLGNGNAPRNGERAARSWTTDLSFSKKFPVHSMFLVVRLDAFNLFKQNDYGAPVLTMSSPSFGQNTNNWGRRTLNASAKMEW